MKFLTSLAFIGVVVMVLIAGCTTPVPVMAPATPVATVTPQVTPVPTPLTDSLLLGTWNLKAMNIRSGTALTVPNSQISINFYDQSTLSGFSGCNNYNAPYSLPGTVLYSGQGITIGTIISTQKYCAGSSDTESTYLSILQKATSYVVNGDTLTITDNLANQLVYKR
jgi:heat shock protein HslJ